MDQKNISTFLLGLSVGVGISMLLAPRSGQATRALIRGKASEGTEYLKQRGVDVKQTAAEWVGMGKEVLRRQKGSVADGGKSGEQIYRDGTATST